MAQLMIAAAGAAIGNAIAPGIVALGMTGGSIGWMASSLIGSTFGPTQKAQGPRLGDLTVGGSSYGAIIPYVDGHPRLAGQIIWASTKREIATTRRESGKGGGGGTAVTTFTYEVDILILLTDCEIHGVRRIWSGGDLIYTAASDADATSLTASINTPQWTSMTVYTGDAAQLPDPDYEAAVGAANAPAYRGRGTVFIKSLQLGQNGQIPNLTFEVVRTGVDAYAETFFVDSKSGDGSIQPGISYPSVVGFFVDFTKYKFGNASLNNSIGDYKDAAGPSYSAETLARLGRQRDGVATGDWVYEAWVYVTSYGSGKTFWRIAYESGSSNPRRGHHGLAMNSSGNIYPVIHDADRYLMDFGSGLQQAFQQLDERGTAGENLEYWKSDPQDVSVNPAVLPLNTWTHIVMQCTEGGIIDTWCGGEGHRHSWAIEFRKEYSGGVLTTTYPSGYYPLSPLAFAALEAVHSTDDTTGRVRYDNASTSFDAGHGKLDILASSTVVFDSFRLSSDSIYRAAYSTPTAAFTVGADTVTLYQFNEYQSISPVDPPISDVVERLCERAGLSASQYDVTGIDAITTPVYGLMISQVTNVRSVLEMLMGCYFFDCVLSDKLYFRARAGAIVATLANADLGWAVDGMDMPDPLPLTMDNELELPAQMALTYNNIDADYQTDTQYSDRLITGQENTAVIQVPLGLTAAQAKIIAVARLTDAYVARLKSQITVSLAYSHLEPSDAILVCGADGSQFRQRLLKRTDADCVLSFDTVADDSTVFTRLGLTVGGTDSQTTVAALPETELELLDIPLLRDAENMMGIYVAVGGPANWHAADVYHSSDNVNFEADASFTQKAVMGSTTDALDDWTGGTVLDTFSSVTVNVGDGELESVTHAELLANKAVNAAVIGNELVQFRDATLVSTGVYTLTNFIRGRRGTEWAMVDHGAGERFVLLATSGMRFLTLQTSDYARPRYYKGVSAGQRLSAVTAEYITPVGVNLMPFSPVNVRVDRSGANPVVTWSRRTRLSVRVGGAVQSIPLGETSEAYEVDVYDDSEFTTLIDTIETTTASATITDSGSPSGGPLYLRIYQMSEIVGRGYPAEVTLP